jgi:hypothetical protein
MANGTRKPCTHANAFRAVGSTEWRCVECRAVLPSGFAETVEADGKASAWVNVLPFPRPQIRWE